LKGRERSTVKSTVFANLLLIALVVGGLFVPLGALVAKLSSFGAVATAFQTYGGDVVASLAIAFAAGVGAMAVAVAVGYVRGVRWPATLIAALLGILPGALIGEALIAGFNRPSLAWVYDGWPIVTLAYLARFGWLGAVAGWLISREAAGCAAEQAATDGASRAQVMYCVILPGKWMMLAGIGAAVAALSLAELVASAMVRVPSFSPISQVIIEKFHRFEDDMLISLSLLLVLAAVPAALLIAGASRRQDS
jgi:ABC-type Fe3+ transport system permease subunit